MNHPSSNSITSESHKPITPYIPDDIWYIILVKLYRSGEYNLVAWNKQSQRIIERINAEREWVDVPWVDGGVCEAWWTVGQYIIQEGYIREFE